MQFREEIATYDGGKVTIAGEFSPVTQTTKITAIDRELLEVTVEVHLIDLHRTLEAILIRLGYIRPQYVRIVDKEARHGRET